MRTREVAHLGVQVNEFDAVRETVMRNLDVFVVQPVAFLSGNPRGRDASLGSSSHCNTII
ncbi:MAG: hypothetical protein CBCREVIR_2897 [Candidatus Burkholderia crenata]|nr:MAG: hypothetical protein CBCREVIR_2897 [Candidatus Burkholderia crenata]